MKDQGAKSKESFQLLYELVENSEAGIIHKSKKCQWKHKFTGDKIF